MRTHALRSLPIVLVLAAGAGTGLLATGRTDAPGQARFHSRVDLVALNVVVTDAQRQFVPNLGQSDFVVLEDGVPQAITFFAGGQVPLDVVLLIDTSSSMRPVHPLVHRAANGFLRALRPGDRGAVLGFDRTVHVLQDLTEDRGALRANAARAGASGDTALYDALYVTLRQYGQPARQTEEVRRQAIVVITDGEENTSSMTYEELLSEARSRGVAIYAIVMQSALLRQREQRAGRSTPTRWAMQELSRETGALAYFPDRATDLGGVYETIAGELANEYSIAYAPRQEPGLRALRSVAVRVASQPALMTRTRTSYLADGPALRMASLP